MSGPGACLDKARRSLEEARAVASIGFFEAGGRAAYLAAQHAAQAPILARTQKVAKTHSGIRSEFARLVKDDASFSRHLTTFLSQACNLKVAADYAVVPNLAFGADEAAEAIAEAARFIEAVDAALPPAAR